jgi:tetratricopeptide (TPR) repeat protein
MMQKNWWVLAFSLFCFAALHGQTVSETWSGALADEEAGRYRMALEKYERVLFFKPDTITDLLYLHIGNCRMYNKEYYSAINSYDDALLADIHKLRQNEILVQRLKAEIQAHNMRLALITLREIDTLKDVTVRDQVVFYTGVIHFFNEEYPEAENSWIRLAKKDVEKEERIRALFRENKKVNRLKPGVAIALSVVLPGAGQVYAGDIKDGINSLLLTGGLFILGYNTAIVYGIYNAIVAVGPWYLRYYQGGFTKAGQLVMLKRAQKHEAIYNQLLDVLKK